MYRKLLPLVVNWYISWAEPKAQEIYQQLAVAPQDLRKERIRQLFTQAFPQLWMCSPSELSELPFQERWQGIIWLALAVAQMQRGEVSLQPFGVLDEKFREREWKIELPEAIQSRRYVQVGEEAGDCFYYCACGLVEAAKEHCPQHIELWLERIEALRGKVQKEVDQGLDEDFFSRAVLGKYLYRAFFKKDKKIEYQRIAQATGIPIEKCF
jgi:hypothetical protein